jgi:hypothetical protein
MAEGDLIGESESTLQAQAVAQEVVVAQDVVSIVAEPVTAIEVATPQEVVVTEGIHVETSTTHDIAASPVTHVAEEVKA